MNAVVLWLAVAGGVAFGQRSAADQRRFFDKRVAPILRKHCLGCHNDELNNGGISFLDRASLLKRGERGAAIVPGKPEESLLIDAIRYGGEVKMPPGVKLSAKEIAALTLWVKNGAVWGNFQVVDR